MHKYSVNVASRKRKPLLFGNRSNISVTTSLDFFLQKLSRTKYVAQSFVSKRNNKNFDLVNIERFSTSQRIHNGAL